MAGQNQVPREPFKLRIAILLAKVISRFFWLINRRILYRVADAGGLLFYYLFPTYRRNVTANIATVLGPDACDKDVRRVTRSAFRTSARNFADLMRVPYLPRESFLESVRMESGSMEVLDRVSCSGKGAVLVTAHYGAFDYVGQIIWLNGYALTLLTARTVPELIDAAVSYLRGSRGARMEPATPGGLRRVISSLKRGELIGIVADRDFFQNGKPVTFFGRRTTLPPGPIRIARDAGAPIVPAFARREGDGYYMVVEQPFMVPRTADVETDVQWGLERLVEVLERNLRAAPEQWVMFQRVWTDAPQQPIRVFPVGSPLEGRILGPRNEETGPLTAEPAGSAEQVPEERPEPQASQRFARNARQDVSGSS